MLLFSDEIKRSMSKGKESKKREIGKGGRYAKPFSAPKAYIFDQTFFKSLMGKVKEKEVI